MMTIAGVTLSPVAVLVGAVVFVLFGMGVLRFLLRLAWRLVGIVLSLVIFGGIILFLMNAIQIK
jgi:hypothetical protein